jgi:hypothetical protein
MAIGLADGDGSPSDGLTAAGSGRTATAATSHRSPSERRGEDRRTG